MYVRLAFAVAAHLEPEILHRRRGAGGRRRRVPAEVPRQDGRRRAARPHGALRQPQHGRNHAALPAGDCGSTAVACARAASRPTLSRSIRIRRRAIGGLSLYGRVHRSINTWARSTSDSRRSVSGAKAATWRRPSTCAQPFTIDVQYRVLRRTTNLRVGIRLSAHEGTVLLSTTDMDGNEELTARAGSLSQSLRSPWRTAELRALLRDRGLRHSSSRKPFHVDHGLAFQMSRRPGALAGISMTLGRVYCVCGFRGRSRGSPIESTFKPLTRYGARAIQRLRQCSSGPRRLQAMDDSTQGLEEWWEARTRSMAALVPPGARVIEFGAGRRLQGYRQGAHTCRRISWSGGPAHSCAT